MIYVISDIHGCFGQFKKLLSAIHFSDSDELFVLGDILDRGPEPIRLIQYLMSFSNIYPVLGNHDYMALKVLSKLNVEITDQTLETLSSDDITAYMNWTQDGGDITAKQFTQLDIFDREDILDYLGECSLYEDIRVKGRRYILVHAGLMNFTESRPLDAYRPEELIFLKPDYSRRYFKDEKTFLITGHTPTMSLHSDSRSEIYRKNGHIAIDCGCVYGGKLAAFCLDTEECFYEN